jgi:hypothetical protein
MFKDTTPTKIDRANFGAGSMVKDGADFYLVIAVGPRLVGLVYLEKFQLIGGDEAWLDVMDCNHLTESEARKLVAIINGRTFSDFELLPGGLKDMRVGDTPERQYSGRGCGINKF